MRKMKIIEENGTKRKHLGLDKEIKIPYCFKDDVLALEGVEIDRKNFTKNKSNKDMKRMVMTTQANPLP